MVLTLRAGALTAEIATLGASLHGLHVPDRHGTSENIVLGYRDAHANLTHPVYFGAVVGRFANRIRAGRFELEGRTCQLPLNDPPNHLHGGPTGFHAREWTVTHLDDSSATLSLVSEDGDNGYPGRLEAQAHYMLGEDALVVELRATTSAPTIANLSHHPYWNLAGEASGTTIAEHWLRLDADRFTPTDSTMIPTGELRPVPGTAFDFRQAKPIGRDIDADEESLRLGQGYDHNLAMAGWDGDLRRVATLFDPHSGRALDVSAQMPGLQFYSGNYLVDLPEGTSGRSYPRRGGLCLEPQHFPNAPNEPGFPSARLMPGEVFVSRIEYCFRTADDVEAAFG